MTRWDRWRVGRVPHVDRSWAEDVELLEVWSDPQDAPDLPSSCSVADGIGVGIGIGIGIGGSRGVPADDRDWADWLAPITGRPNPLAPAGTTTCIRLNCADEGRPTGLERCPSCGHRTVPLRDYRWPRVIRASASCASG